MVMIKPVSGPRPVIDLEFPGVVVLIIIIVMTSCHFHNNNISV